VRFNSEISGYETLGTLGRGSSMEIGSYDNSIYLSDVSGNVIDLCPVGALTSNVFSFSSRPWELKIYESIELSDGIGNTVYLSLKESEIQRVSSKSNYKVKDIFISDRARYYFDYQKTRLNSIYINFKEITKIKNIFNIEILLKSKSKHNNILFLVDNSLDFDSLFYSKTLTNSNKNFFEKKSFSFLIRSTPTNLCSNYYINWLNSPISQFKNNSNNCFLVSSCLKVENVLINSKLFIKKAQHNFLIFGFLLYSQNNLNVEFLNLNLKNMFFYFEGKFFLCKFFINQKFPLFILGENFFRRAICLPFANILLNTINNSSIFLKSQLSINEEGKAILHIFPVTTRSLKISNFLIFADLEDSFFLKKLLFKTKSEVILLGSHKSSLFNNRIKNFIPCTTEYEEEKVFVNLEQRFQKTTKILIPNKKVLTIRNILYLFFNIKKISLYIEFLNVFKEMYINLELFDKKENFLLSHIRRCLLMVFMLSYEKYLISLYPAKLNVEDSYLSNKILKNSKNMQIISQFTRKKSINFL
jgi:NADH dehydrogenase (ubiquinone) Fe-S protein 1